MQMLVSELFKLVEKAESKQEKINLLRSNDVQEVRAILTLNYNPDFKLNLPEGTPPFRKEENPIGYQATTIKHELRRFYIWMQPNELSRTKRETLFIEMLEGLHFTEAEIICAAKDRQLTTLYPSITASLAKEAYPDIFPPTMVIQEETKPKKARSKKSKEPLPS